MYDLLLKHGHVIDPKNNIDGKMDVAISGGKIAAVAADINPALASKMVDASGLLVTPGLIDMQTTMSKILNCGMPLQEVIYRSTVTPANEIGHPELGNLSLGSEADVALLKLHKGEFAFVDCGKAKLLGDQKLECQMTLRAGEIVYDPTGLSMPRWQDAPAPYWVNPSLQG